MKKKTKKKIEACDHCNGSGWLDKDYDIFQCPFCKLSKEVKK